MLSEFEKTDTPIIVGRATNALVKIKDRGISRIQCQ